MQPGSTPADPLRDVRVVEWSNSVSAPFCGKLLGELGADVIKIEPPGRGKNSRSAGPFPNQEPHPERSGLFLFANLNKRGITLDLETDAGRGLLESADVFLENQPIELLERTRLDYPSLQASHSPFGSQINQPLRAHRALQRVQGERPDR